MTPKEFIDENYFSLTIDCKREINEIYQALKDYAKIEQCNIHSFSGSNCCKQCKEPIREGFRFCSGECKQYYER